jgi:putative acetyltransferase
LNLRPARPDDAAAIAFVHHTAMRVSLPFLPELHTLDEVVVWAAGQILPNNQVWVAERDGEVCGYIAFAADWINDLYVLPEVQGQGIGPQLLAKALADGRTRRLWTFQRNTRARGFYESRGFVLVELTDGSGNEEKEPDALYEWRAAPAPKEGL